MSRFPTGRSRAGADICKILGLDPAKTKSLSIFIEPESLITVQVVFHPDVDQWQQIEDRFTEEMKTYRLIEIKQEDYE